MLPKSILNDRTLLSELYLSRICHLNQFSSILSKIFYAFWALGTIFDPKKLFLRPGNDWFWCNMQKSTSNNQTLLSELHWSWIYHLNQFSSTLRKNFHAFWALEAIFWPKRSFLRLGNGLFRFNIAKIYFEWSNLIEWFTWKSNISPKSIFKYFD